MSNEQPPPVPDGDQPDPATPDPGLSIPPPSPPPPAGRWNDPHKPERFRDSSVIGGGVVGFFGSFVAAFVGLLLGTANSSGSASPVLIFLPLVALLALAVGLLTAGKTPRARGWGLGLLIGWGLALIIGGGLCIALISSFSN